jgi:molybdopterin converting factor small subunit
MAEFRFLGYLSEVAGVQIMQIPLEKPTRLRDILARPSPGKNIIFLIDQKMGNLDSIIQDNNSVVIMPILSGG